MDSANCTVIAGPGEPIATVALSDAVDPSRAPRPTNDSERLLFRQVYETLVRADCEGHTVPGLAIAWRLDLDPRTWVFTLRDHARFSDGALVTAADVQASWSLEGGDELRSDVGRVVESIVALDDRTVAVTLRRAQTAAPIGLAHPDLAIAKITRGSSWPLGTRVDRATPRRTALTGTPGATITIERENRPAISFLAASGDPRDVLDKGVDLLLTRDATALAYAGTLPSFQVLPLPWQRTLVLLSAGRSRTAGALPENARHAFARDAVRGEARGAVGPFWWEALQACALLPPQARDRRTWTPRVVYDSRDDAAHDVAERLVGLARAPGTSPPILDVVLPDRPARTYQRTGAMTGEVLARARRLGNDASYLVSLDRRPLDPCGEMQALTGAVPWLDPETIVPLVDLRLRAVVRKGRAGIVAEWDGGLLLSGASDPRQP